MMVFKAHVAQANGFSGGMNVCEKITEGKITSTQTQA